MLTEGIMISILKVFFFAKAISVLCFSMLVSGEGLPAQELQKESLSAPAHAYFSPDDHLADHLIGMIDKENKSIKMAMYVLTHRGIAQALGKAKKRGVEIEVIADPFSAKRHSALSILMKAGISVWIWDPPLEKDEKKPLMHDKFCVFGKKMVWTGSFNCTYDADVRNQENAIVFENPELALRFEERFNQIKKQSTLFKIPEKSKGSEKNF